MSNESGQSEQEKPQEQAPKWGDPISEERQAELDVLAEQQRRWVEQPEAARGDSPLTAMEAGLTGADVFWLVKRALAGPEGDAAALSTAEARLQDHNNPFLPGLSALHLEGADLRGVHLQGADLRLAHLERANLGEAHLQGANLDSAHLDDANLIASWFDKSSKLNDATLSGVSFDQASFDNTNLTVVDWSLVDSLGDERTARTAIGVTGKHKDRDTQLSEYKSAVRANRVLSVALQAQGLTEDASRFAYHAQVLQRELYRRQRKVGAYLFSLLIAALSGYGYRLGRILIAYGLSLAVFAAAYFTAGQWFGAAHLTWYQAILVSLTAIHGRVFFEQFGLNSIQSWIAAVESVVGIVIEGVFVAMLIQRFFGR